MSDVKRVQRYDPSGVGRMSANQFGDFVKAADYDALLASHEQAWKAANSECQGWARESREYEKRRAAEAERDQLRAELAAIRGQEVIGRVHHNEEHAEPVRAVLNSIGRELPDNSPLYALPPQQPDAVSVPRELLERLAKKAEVFDDGSDGADAESARSVAETLRALLSTRQAEEGE